MFRKLFKSNEERESDKHGVDTKFYCRHCQDLFTRALTAGAPGNSRLIHRHHGNYQSLSKAAKSGCKICIVILEEFHWQVGSTSERFKTPIRYTLKTSMIEVDAQEWLFMIEKPKKKAGPDKEGDCVLVSLRCEPTNPQIRPFDTERWSALESLPSR